jgi:exoribonuclease-2
VARERLSTVYFPGGKLTMLPDEAIARYTLAAGTACPALSFYTEIAPDFTVVSTATRIERVNIAANLRHETLEPVFNETALASGHIAHEHGVELKFLWEWAQALSLARRGGEPEVEQRAEYLFRVAGDRVQIRRRLRGTPIDQLVAEMMIYVNSRWGSDLAQSGTAAIYRVQGNGKVRMSTVPAAHEGLGVEQYSWASSPLRRYIDLVNQRQLIAMVGGHPPPYRAADESLLAAMRDFEATYDSYLEFQRNMERYWCLRWLLQENVAEASATVIRDTLVRFDDLPLVARVPSLAPLAGGTQVTLAISAIDLFELTLHCEYQPRKVAEQALAIPGASAEEA